MNAFWRGFCSVFGLFPPVLELPPAAPDVWPSSRRKLDVAIGRAKKQKRRPVVAERRNDR